MKVRKRSRINTSVDLVPLIDIVFQLILFFLVSTTFSVLPGINLNLPQSKTAQGLSIAEITITAKEDNTLWFNDQKVSYQGLNKELSHFDTKQIDRKNYPITLSADSNVTNGEIVKIFDVIRQNGFSAVNLRTTNITEH